MSTTQSAESNNKIKRAMSSKKIIAVCPNCRAMIRAEYVMNNDDFNDTFLETQNFPFW